MSSGNISTATTTPIQRVTFTCPSLTCGKRLQADVASAGQPDHCPVCGTALVIPAPRAVTADSPQFSRTAQSSSSSAGIPIVIQVALWVGFLAVGISLGYVIFDDTGAIEFAKQQAESERAVALDAARKQHQSDVARISQQLMNETQAKRVLASELERLRRGMNELRNSSVAAERIATLESELERREAELKLKDREIQRLQEAQSPTRPGRSSGRSGK